MDVPSSSVDSFISECSLNCRKLSKSIVEENAKILDAASSEWIELFRSRVSTILATSAPSDGYLGMYILFLINKARTKLASWQSVLASHLSGFLAAVPTLKDLDHVEKIVNTWTKQNSFPADLTASWLKEVELERARRLAALTAKASISAANTATAATEVSASHSRLSDSQASSLSHIWGNTSLSPSKLLATPASHNTPVHGASDETSFIDQRPLPFALQEQFQRICQYTHAIAQSLISQSQKPKEVTALRAVLSAAFCFLHIFACDLRDRDDPIALSLASLYLAGKVEYFHIKLDRLRTIPITTSLATDLFGVTALPGDRQVFECERLLLQAVGYDVNHLFNPIKLLQAVSLDFKHIRPAIRQRAEEDLSSLPWLQARSRWRCGGWAVTCYALLWAEHIEETHGGAKDVHDVHDVHVRWKKYFWYPPFQPAAVLRQLRELVLAVQEDAASEESTRFHCAVLDLLQRLLQAGQDVQRVDQEKTRMEASPVLPVQGEEDRDPPPPPPPPPPPAFSPPRPPSHHGHGRVSDGSARRRHRSRSRSRSRSREGRPSSPRTSYGHSSEPIARRAYPSRGSSPRDEGRVYVRSSLSPSSQAWSGYGQPSHRQDLPSPRRRPSHRREEDAACTHPSPTALSPPRNRSPWGYGAAGSWSAYP